tara:strand:- start:9696 stop:10589 length:894 start_codon:yes stop_codon:yes gene_type:complete
MHFERFHVILHLLKATRPHEWIKNLFVLAALVFSGHLFDLDYASRAGLALVAFILLSAAIYLLNDICDRDRDREHPQKRHRPIASGNLPIPVAIVAAILFATIAIWLGFRLDARLGWTACIYVIQNLAYSFALKNVVILDVMIVATGFLLRAVAGAFAIDVTISSWFILCTMLISLFLGFVKRRQEVVLLADHAGQHRSILVEYEPRLLDQLISVATAGTLVSYALYAMSPDVIQKSGTPHLYLTIPFVIYGLFRYLFLVYTRDGGGNPAVTILNDFPMLLNGALWAATFVGILYFR